MFCDVQLIWVKLIWVKLFYIIQKKKHFFFIGNRTFIQETENFNDGEHSKEETNTTSSRT